MSEILERVSGFFVAPAGERPAPRGRVRAAPPSVAILGRPSVLTGAASALALGLARSHEAPCGLVASWSGGEGGDATRPLRAPARLAARRLAARLGARDIPALASGRLVHVTLPPATVDACAAAQRVAGAAACPAVFALGGARDRAVDGLLAAVDLVVVLAARGPTGALAAAARAGFADLRVPAVTCSTVERPLMALLASTGLYVPADLRSALGPALEAAA